MARSNRITPGRRRRALLDLVVYGVACGLLIAVVELTEFRFLVVEHSVAVYGGLIAVVFAGLGIWLGATIRRRRSVVVVEDPPPSERFALDEARRVELGITERELEILGLIASGLSNREIGERLFISENTVKTHSSRLFDKLGARRRTEAVRIGRASRLVP
jgi:DNA-binding CsgD family transcriptional regulator